VKKTAWTREEEEKLLHLAKIMPTQWRTIAGCLEGRTATMCLQHYEKLLDQAQGKDGLDGADDPRRLRPGEIDPNPEVKPALPDPVDFDEDEKEMLQEARARLANTKGKKAKRKAREKTLDEAKRMAALQKRRELKAAGIHMPVPATAAGAKKRRVKMVDVMAEIPFHKTAPSGFYDTGKEDAREAKLTQNPRFRQMTLQKLEGERGQELEAREKKKDNERMKKLKQDNLPVAMAKISKLNDAKNTAVRPDLNLPAPQITNSELEEIAKVANRGDMEEEEGVTTSLLPRVDQTPSITPMRTPLAAPGADTVQREAQYLAAMSRETQTPLLR
jgi:pre-mRNA-splicing factor CDC5/CEF1